MKVNYELNLSNDDLLSEKALNELRGGFAKIESKEDVKSEAGDGAKYACCINVNL